MKSYNLLLITLKNITCKELFGSGSSWANQKYDPNLARRVHQVKF